MKKYLLGLGAMLVGAGLMFVFTHTEVSAESEASKPESFACGDSRKYNYGVLNCKTTTLDCAITRVGISCVKK